VQSAKTAERLGLLIIEVQAFLFVLRQKTSTDYVNRARLRAEEFESPGRRGSRLIMLSFLDPAGIHLG